MNDRTKALRLAGDDVEHAIVHLQKAVVPEDIIVNTQLVLALLRLEAQQPTLAKIVLLRMLQQKRKQSIGYLDYDQLTELDIGEMERSIPGDER